MFAVPSFFGYNTTFVNGPVATAATGVGETSFTANWNSFAGASYYLLDVSLSSSFSSFVLQDTVTTATSYVVTGLTASTTYYYRIRAAINVDSDVAGFVSRVYTAGGTLSYTEVTATETLVADLKSYGIWTAMKAVYPMVGASAAACAQNLVSSSFTGSFTSGWTFASTGATPNGTSAYMDTNYSPSVNSTITDNHFMMYLPSVSIPSGYTCDLGAFSADYNSRFGTGYYQNPSLDTTNFDVRKRTTVSNSLIGSGFILYSRSASNLAKVYFNNSIVATDSSSTLSYGFPNITVYLGALHLGTTTVSYSDRRNAFASMGDSLTDTQASNFYTAVQAFQTTLSRQV